MSDDFRRPLRLFDLALLVAACGLGLYIARPVYDELIVHGTPPNAVMPSDPWGFSMAVAEMWVPPLTVPLGFAILLGALHRPRPELSEMAKQPGVVAAAVVCGFILFGGVLVLLKHLAGVPIGRWYPLPPWSTHLTKGAGGAIAACWLMLAIGRNWNPQPTWPDRLGRLFGPVWILSWALLYFQSIRVHIAF